MEPHHAAPHHEKGPKKAKHPHHVVPKHELGYTDEAAEECHDLIDRAEEEAHLHEPGSMYSSTTDCTTRASHELEPTAAASSGKAAGGAGSGMMHKAKGGLEGTGGKMHETGKSLKSTVGEKMEHMKEAMHMKK